MPSASPSQLALIVAHAREGIIGRAGTIPWHLSTDLRRFKRLTWDHTIILGRHTFDSLKRPLPHRRHVVLTRQTEFEAPGVLLANNWCQALRLSAVDPLSFVIGGGEIYRLAVPDCQRAYVTEVVGQIEGDTYFDPSWLRDWSLIHETYFPAGPRDDYPHWFRVFERPDA
jgi:dihydrofolate reductase